MSGTFNIALLATCLFVTALLLDGQILHTARDGKNVVTSMNSRKKSTETADQSITADTDEDNTSTAFRNELNSTTAKLSKNEETSNLKKYFASKKVPEPEAIIAETTSQTDAVTFTKSRSKKEKFNCPPCTCIRNYRGRITGNCTSENLKNIPLDLPKSMFELEFVNNSLMVLYIAQLLQYPLLSNVTISYNANLTAVKNNSTGNFTLPITNLDVSHNNISYLEDGSFVFLPNLTKLTVNYNMIKNINNNTFVGLGHLKTLVLSNNNIKRIDFGAFIHLRDLKTLDLSGNKHLGYRKSVFSPLLFQNLNRLTELDIQGNSNGADTAYPNEALGQIKNLQRLSIDGLNSDIVFGHEISTLKQLTQLEIQGRCLISNLTKPFFENLQRLESFSMDTCNKLHFIDSNAYPRSLKSLTLKYMNNYHLYTALDGLQGLENSSLSSLSFIHLYDTKRPHKCQYLEAENAKHLTNMPLEKLELSSNLLIIIGKNFVNALPRTIKQLVLSNNKFMASVVSLGQMHVLTQLEELDLSIQNLDSNLNFRPRNPHCESNEENADNMLDMTSPDSVLGATAHVGHSSQSYSQTNGGAEITAEALHECDSFSTDQNRDNMVFSSIIDNDVEVAGSLQGEMFPPNLKVIRANFFNGFGLKVITGKIPRNNSLRELYFSGSMLTDFTHGVIPREITRVDLSKNYCKHISKTFFKTNNTLKYLSMSRNFLGSEFADDLDGDIFAELKQVIYLDISLNSIYRLSEAFLQGMKSLQTLLISENRIQTLKTRFSNLTSLNYLDLSKNSISWITRHTRKDLDEIAVLHEIYVDLTYNPLPCTCGGLEILLWIATTKVNFLNEDFLYCRFDDGSEELYGNFDQRLQWMQRLCATKSTIIVICVSCFVVLAVIFVFGTMYRFRWRLRYFHSVTMAKLVGFKPRKTNIAGYKFDALLLYSEDSRDFVLQQCRHELEVQRGHKLCLDERDFLPGTYTVSAIVNAIQNSGKVIPVITPDFYEEEYSEYGVKMSLLEELHTKRSVLHLCLYQPMPSDKISKCTDLLMVMKRNNYTEFPPSEAPSEVQQNFWDQLSRAIGHNGVPIIQPSV